MKEIELKKGIWYKMKNNNVFTKFVCLQDRYVYGTEHVYDNRHTHVSFSKNSRSWLFVINDCEREATADELRSILPSNHPDLLKIKNSYENYEIY